MSYQIGKAAFPSIEPGNMKNIYKSGMLLVDYFASKALEALILKQDHTNSNLIAIDAYEHAISMMKEREKLIQEGKI